MDVFPSLVGQLVGERFYIVRTCPWVDFLSDVGFFLDVNLGVAGNTCREVGWQCDSLVEGVGVERLGVSQRCAHSLDTCTAYVVEWVLLGERPS